MIDKSNIRLNREVSDSLVSSIYLILCGSDVRAANLGPAQNRDELSFSISGGRDSSSL